MHAHGTCDEATCPLCEAYEKQMGSAPPDSEGGSKMTHSPERQSGYIDGVGEEP
jgi:hypothetical protein